jgi:hypothetical protein
MSNISKNKISNEVHLHTDKAYSIIDLYLPPAYVSLVQNKLAKKGSTSASSSIIRNVRNKYNTRLDILLALVEVALENKANIAKLKRLTT